MQQAPPTPNNPIKAPRKGFAPAEWLAALLLVALLALVCWRAGLGYAHEAEARAVLAQAQALRVAAHAVGLQALADGTKLSDPTGPYGFAPGKRAAILELSGAPGELWLLRADEAGYNMLEFLYVQGGYAVRCVDGGREPDAFSVFRLEAY